MIKTGKKEDELEEFKRRATSILESRKFPGYKWESNVGCLKSEDLTNTSKILGTVWDKNQNPVSTSHLQRE